MSEIVRPGKVVLMHYTLTSDQGEVIDTSDGREPMAYLHGADNIVPGLERQLEGLALGSSIRAVVTPAEGYGDRNEDATQVLPRDLFPADMELEPGMPFAAEAGEGQVMHFFVVSIQEDAVLVDANHPLAGMNLNFAVEIVGIRDPTAEELEHGHPHGPEGHDTH